MLQSIISISLSLSLPFSFFLPLPFNFSISFLFFSSLPLFSLFNLYNSHFLYISIALIFYIFLSVSFSFYSFLFISFSLSLNLKSVKKVIQNEEKMRLKYHVIFVLCLLWLKEMIDWYVNLWNAGSSIVSYPCGTELTFT